MEAERKDRRPRSTLRSAAPAALCERQVTAREACRGGIEGLRRAVILLDTSGLLAAIDQSQREHAACASLLRESHGPRLLTFIAISVVVFETKPSCLPRLVSEPPLAWGRRSLRCSTTLTVAHVFEPAADPELPPIPHASNMPGASGVTSHASPRAMGLSSRSTAGRTPRLPLVSHSHGPD